jgi:hypothetical protein
MCELATHRDASADVQRKTSVNLSVSESIVGVGEDVGHSYILPFVFTVFPQSLPCNHDGHRRLGDEIVTEGAKQDTATISMIHSKRRRMNLPL